MCLCHSLVLTSIGEVYAWGWNDFGQVGNRSYENQLVPLKVKGIEKEIVTLISCGTQYPLALTKSGLVFSWGDNQLGQLRIEGIKYLSTPVHIKLDEKINKISCGQHHSLLLSNSEVIYAFGYNNFGQSRNGTKEIQIKPAKLNHERKFIDIASHWSRGISIALSSDNIYYVWGNCKNDILIPRETRLKS